MKRFLFFALASLFPCCAGKSDVTLYHEGRAAEDSGDFKLAVERYEEVIDRFQTSAYAESSLYRAGLVYNNDLHDVQKSIASYRKFWIRYPGSKEAPTALFLTGFLFNNEIHQLDSAKTAYETFLQKYPHHDLAASATFELQTLGKDPEARLGGDTTAPPGAGAPKSARVTSK